MQTPTQIVTFLENGRPVRWVVIDEKTGRWLAVVDFGHGARRG